MYSTKTAIQISLKDILDGISDYDIYAYYIGKFKVGKLYNSPLRNNDLIPSFAIFPSRNGDLLFKDFGGDSLRAIAFVSKLFDLNFPETLRKINYDFGLGLENGEIDNSKFENSDITLYDKEDLIIKIKKRKKGFDFSALLSNYRYSGSCRLRW